MTTSTSTLRYDHQSFSDLYKEAHGCRPRFRMDDGRFDQWEIDNLIEHLCAVVEINLEEAPYLEEEVRWEAFSASPTPDPYEVYCV